MMPREVAEAVWQLPLLPLDNLNAYLVGGVLFDSGAPVTRARLLRALAGHPLAAHALTHAHPDHQGASAAVCLERGIPLWCGERDRSAAETGSFSSVLPAPGGLMAYLADRIGGPGHPVARTLVEGDRIADFEVVETPGHTPGHLSFWRQPDGVVILGDVAFGRSPLSFRAGLREPFPGVTHDPVVNRRSARKIADLRPSLVCFGHGSPMDGDRFARWVSQLP